MRPRRQACAAPRPASESRSPSGRPRSARVGVRDDLADRLCGLPLIELLLQAAVSSHSERAVASPAASLLSWDVTHTCASGAARGR